MDSDEYNYCNLESKLKGYSFWISLLLCFDFKDNVPHYFAICYFGGKRKEFITVALMF